MDSSILVIGAGAAGLSATSELLRQGFKNVKIYEARPRIGGRIHTESQNAHGPAVEFGAQWIHGQINNPVYEICKKEGLVNEEHESLFEKFYDWRQLDDEQNEVAKKLVAYCRDVMDECDELSTTDFRNSGKPIAESLFDYLSNKVTENWLNKEKNETNKQTIREVFDWFVRLQNEVNGGEAEKVSVNYIGEYHEYDGNVVVQLGPQGYFGFLSVLLRDVPTKKIHLSVEVTKIDYTTSPVKVISSLGEENFDFVICTIPLGVLKERKLELFTPQLPADKLRTIDALGYGICNKIYLEFESKDVFWQAGDSIQILWKDENPTSEKTWMHRLSRFNAVAYNPNLLVGWVGGEDSKDLEEENDENVLQKCHETLRMALGKDVPKPVAIRRSSWFSDAFSRGSYSYISTACDNGEPYALLPSTLANPILVDGKPVVCFAGEATSSHYYSTVHGAFETGKREAERILKYVQTNASEIKSSTYGNVDLDSPRTANGAQKLLPETDEACTHVNVIIVGAGAAGLGAALSLTQAGIDCIVLEAQNEAGGRIRSQYFDGGCLELGAQWVHGEHENPVYDFCVKHELLTDPEVDYSVEGKGTFLLPDGSVVPEEHVEEALKILDGVKEELATLKYRTSTQCEALGFKSVGEMYRARFEKARPRSRELDCAMKAIMDWYTKFEIVDNACRDIDNLSLSGFGHYLECPGVYYINFKDGYESFTRTVLRILPKDCVRLSTPVNHIEWSRDSEIVRIVTDQGAVFSCDHLIVTPSVEVLKNLKFLPALPTYKLEALSCFGFDTINKIFLHWDEQFWTSDILGFQLLWPEYDEEFFKVHGKFLRGIYGFERVNHNRNYLLTWIGGDEAKEMESLSDETILEGCYQLLKRFASKLFDVTRPSKLIRSSWGSNEYIRGAYSHRLLKFDHVDDPVEKLQRPICDSKKGAPRLLFAGEATDSDYFSTVHGAFRSGDREADRIISFQKNYKTGGDVWRCNI